MKNYFRGFSVEHIEREKNTEADELVKATTRKTTLLPDVFLNTQRLFSENSGAEAQDSEYHPRRRLESSNHSIPPPSL
jgi:hypothetical protein